MIFFRIIAFIENYNAHKEWIGSEGFNHCHGVSLCVGETHTNWCEFWPVIGLFIYHISSS